MIIAENICKNYGSLAVLKNIDLKINNSEIVSIVGSSGAGKSTLLHILGTLDSPDSGKVYLDDVVLNSLSHQELSSIRNKKIGFIFQFHNLMSELTAIENICLPAWIGKFDEKEVLKKANELMETLKIAHRKDHYPAEMSGGEQQRVAVARALINSPEFIFADEPSGNLDSANAEELHKLFFNLRDKFKCSFVIVTHNSILANQSDRIIEIVDGQIKI